MATERFVMNPASEVPDVSYMSVEWQWNLRGVGNQFGLL